MRMMDSIQEEIADFKHTIEHEKLPEFEKETQKIIEKAEQIQEWLIHSEPKGHVRELRVQRWSRRFRELSD